MARTRGEVAAKLPKVTDDEGFFSVLPDDVIVLILLRLDTAAAVRTSALSKRWRRVWTLLPEVRFHLAPDGHRIRQALDIRDDEAPDLRRISVTTKAAGPDSAAAWLPVAARRLAGALVYHDMLPGDDAADDEEEQEDEAEAAAAAGDRGELQLPCFTRATTIELNLGYLGLALPSPPGIFSALSELSLRRVRFRGQCEVVGGMVSSPRCPCLKKLEIRDSQGLQHLSIHSQSLLQIKLRNLGTLRHLTIVAPALRHLGVKFSLVDDVDDDDDDDDEQRQPTTASITAPQLVSLAWRDVYDPEFIRLGDLRQLQRLTTNYFLVYGLPGDNNSHFLSLVQRFQVLHTLKLSLVYLEDINDFRYSMGDIKMLPQIMFLRVAVLNQGHAFGASLFHLLRICSGLRRLSVVLNTNTDSESACQSTCNCDQQTDWKSAEVSLNCLGEVEITNLTVSEHEIVFVKRLLSWATELKKMGITFDQSICESQARETLQILASFSRPKTSVEYYMYQSE